MATIASVPELEAMLLGGVVARGPSITDSLHYAAIGCDLCDLSGLEESLALCGIEFSWPTLLLSECVLTYMQPQRYLSDPTAMHPLCIQIQSLYLGNILSFSYILWTVIITCTVLYWQC